MARAKARSGSVASERSGNEKPEKDTKAASDEENEDGEEEGSEYEIEEILEAKRGIYPEGRMGYFVKWKGYADTENSWVDERDAENAIELVNLFWKKQNQKRGRKSTGGDTKPSRLRKSTAEPEEGTPAPKKRGRKSTAFKVDSDGEKEPEEEKAPKKPRKSAAVAEKKAAANKKAASEEMEVDEPPTIGTMKKYMGMKNWEELVRTIDTVERSDDGRIIVYFTLTTGEQVREDSEVCADHFPRSLIRFYESNLRWRSAEEMQDTSA